MAPYRDGTVQIRQRLIFETPPEDGKPVGLWISDAGLGKNPRTGNRLAMMPKVSSLSAVELSTADDSTLTSPKTLGELDIVVDEEKEQGFDHPAAHFMINPKDSDGKATQQTHTLDIDTAGPVFCPADNVDFDLGDGCDAAAFARVDDGDDSETGTHVMWRESRTDSHEIIAFTPPTGMTASPIPAEERQ